jgi:hypothetical protein
MSLSAATKDTCSRNVATSFSMGSELLAGLLKSSACAALNNSMASTFSTLLITRKHFVAALAPMLTWSSWLLDDEILSTEAGVQSCLFSLTMPAAGDMNESDDLPF